MRKKIESMSWEENMERIEREQALYSCTWWLLGSAIVVFALWVVIIETHILDFMIEYYDAL